MDEVDSFGRRGLVVWWEGICCDVGFFGRRDHLLVNKILDLMSQSKATVGVMTMLLVIRAVFRRVMRGREWIW